jgi:hypothetical protein
MPSRFTSDWKDARNQGMAQLPRSCILVNNKNKKVLEKLIFDGMGMIIRTNKISKCCLGRVAFERELIVSAKK